MDLKKIISQGESESLEFKESLKLKDKVGESISYKRVVDTNQRISSSEIRKLAKESGEKIYWDEQICEKATLEDIDWEFVKNFFIPLYEEISKKKITGKVDLI